MENDSLMDVESQENNLSLDDGDEQFASPREVYRRLIEVVNNEVLTTELLEYEDFVVDTILDQVRHMSAGMERYASSLGSFCVEQHQIELERIIFLINKYYRSRLDKIETHGYELVSKTRESIKVQNEVPAELERLKDDVDRLEKSLEEEREKGVRNRELESDLKEDLDKSRKRENDLQIKLTAATRWQRKFLSLVSSLEKKYLDNYVYSIDDYLKGLVSKMPSPYNSFKTSDIPTDPVRGGHDYYFVKCHKPVSFTIRDPTSPFAGEIEGVEGEPGDRRFLPFSAIREHLKQGSSELSIL